MGTKQQLLTEFERILEVPLTEDTKLDSSVNWDSMAVVMFVAAIDDIAGARVSGMKLSKCQSIAEVLQLAQVSA